MKSEFELAKEKYSSVVYEGVEYALLDQAYLDHDQWMNPVYACKAIDKDGNEFMVEWDPVENFMELEDESQCCDWNKPYNVSAY